MSALDRIQIVPLMFTTAIAALASLSPHAKVTGMPGGHASAPLAAEGAYAYLSGLPDLMPVYDFAAVLPFGAPSHGLI